MAKSNRTYRSNCLQILGLAPDDEFPIVQGPAGFVFAGWLPDDRFLARVYDDVIDHTRTITETIAYRSSQLQFAASFLKFVEGRQKRSPLSLLDFGCGYGVLLRVLASREIRAFGFEPSGPRGSTAEQSGATILSDPEAIARAGPFDLCICTEVLEHVPDPRSVVRLLKASATPDALAAITVPNCSTDYVTESLAAAAGGRSTSPVFNPWEHLNYFSQGALRQLLTEERFEVVHDFGRTRTVLEAGSRFGDQPASSSVINSMRVAKRAHAAGDSTEVFCRCG